VWTGWFLMLMAMVGSEAGTYRVNHSYENDWYTLCSPLQCNQSEACWRNQDIGRHLNQFGSLARVAIGIIGTPADIEVEVATLDPA